VGIKIRPLGYVRLLGVVLLILDFAPGVLMPDGSGPFDSHHFLMHAGGGTHSAQACIIVQVRCTIESGYGGYSSAAERLTVAQDVVGSIPTSRPTYNSKYSIAGLRFGKAPNCGAQYFGFNRATWRHRVLTIADHVMQCCREISLALRAGAGRERLDNRLFNTHRRVSSGAGFLIFFGNNDVRFSQKPSNLFGRDRQL
jgi:hypothetical protein